MTARRPSTPTSWRWLVSPVADDPTLTPSEDLALELLAARHRLGEPWWTFTTRQRRALVGLEAKGLINIMSSQTEGTIRAELTEAGRAAALWSGWKPAHQHAVEDIAEQMDDISAMGWWYGWADARGFSRTTSLEMAQDASRVLARYGRLLDADGQCRANEHLASLNPTKS